MVERAEDVTTPLDWTNSDTEIDDLKIDRCEFFCGKPAEAFVESAIGYSTTGNTAENFNGNESSKVEKKAPAPRRPTTRISRRKKKPNGLPKRPLSAYNVFFQQERLNLQKEKCTKIGFQDFGKLIGARWKRLSDEERTEFVERALEDNIRYRREMDIYKASCEEKEKAMEKASKKTEENGESSGLDPWAPSAPLFEPPELQSFYSVDTPIANTSMSSNFLGRGGFSTVPSQGTQFPPSGPFSYVSKDPPPPLPPYQYGPGCDAFPVPPGMEVMLPDQRGYERKYTVHYSVYSMNRASAERYMRSLAASGGYGAGPYLQPGQEPPSHQDEERRPISTEQRPQNGTAHDPPPAQEKPTEMAPPPAQSPYQRPPGQEG